MPDVIWKGKCRGDKISRSGFVWKSERGKIVATTGRRKNEESGDNHNLHFRSRLVPANKGFSLAHPQIRGDN